MVQVLEQTRPQSLNLEWEAVYHDGTIIKQEYNTPREKDISDIDQTKLKEFWLKRGVFGIIIAEQVVVLGSAKFAIEFPRNQRGGKTIGTLVYFRRIRTDFGRTVSTTVRHCLGLKATVEGKEYMQLVFINGDGTFTLSQKK